MTSTRLGVGAATAARALHGFVVLMVVGVLFSNLALYLTRAEHLPSPPRLFAVVLVASAALALAVPATLERALRAPVLGWCAGLAALLLVSFVMTPMTAIVTEHLFRRGLVLAGLAAMIVVLQDPGRRALAADVVAGCVLIGIAFNLVDVVRPLSFSAVLGRSAGLYVNPTISGGALTAGALVALYRIPPGWRAAFLAAAGLGVVTTLSRGAILVWLAAVGVAVAVRQVRAVHLGGWLAAGVAVVLLVATGVGRSIGATGGDVLRAASADRGQRLVVPLADVANGEDGVALRRDVARMAWILFRERPLLGHGLGATAAWPEDQGPHNTYLRGGAEQGVLGVLVMPALMVALLANRRRSSRLALVPYVVFLMGWAVFSQDLLEQWPFAVTTALAASMPPDAEG